MERGAELAEELEDLCQLLAGPVQQALRLWAASVPRARQTLDHLLNTEPRAALHALLAELEPVWAEARPSA